ncbi:sugar ABC transporter permease [Mollicutes bacterium LVI A0039]|nr:sugar ABC transporter permease [Mollicutes bacterium LVI A0039]
MQTKSLSIKIKDNMMYYIFLTPAILFFLIFVMYPFAQGIVFSFQDYGLLGPSGFVGLSNYIKVLTDPKFHEAMINTVIFASITVVADVFLPLFIAIILNETIFKRARNLLHTTVYLPKLLSTVIIVGIFANLLGAGGPISDLAYSLGLTPIPENLMAAPGLARPLFIIIQIWRTIGYYVIMYSAALLAIDPSLYEAAKIDGATWFQQVRYITIPGVSTMMKTVTLLAVMSIFKTFSLSFLLTTPNNAEYVRTLMVYTYQVGILEFDIGMSVASATIVFFTTLIVSLIVRKVIRY